MWPIKRLTSRTQKQIARTPDLRMMNGEKFQALLDTGLVDTFRYFYPDLEGAYSWWSYRAAARAKNVGWRIDYFVVSERLCERLASAKIHSDIMGSDHCPVEIQLKDL